MAGSTQELRQAVRALAQAPLASAATVCGLALGIGAATATFAVLDGAVLRPLQAPQPERVMSVLANHPRRSLERVALTPADFLQLRERSRAFATLGAYVPFGGLEWSAEGEPVRLSRFLVSRGVLESLRVTPALGRAFRQEEYGEGAALAVLISDRLWRERLGSDPAVIGRHLRLGGEPHRVIGVLPRSFRLPGGDPDLVVPLPLGTAQATDREAAYLGAVGRLAPGLTIEEARAELALVAAGLRRELPAGGDLHFDLRPLGELFAFNARGALWLVFAAVGLLLAASCGTAANLQLVRTLARRSDFALRSALGATRLRLARLLLAEQLVLSLLGGAGGWLLARAALRLLPDPRGVFLPASLIPTLGWGAAAFTVVATLVGVGTTLAAAMLGARTRDLARSGRATGGRREERWQAAVVVAQAALAFVLVAGTGSLARAFGELRGADLGLRPVGVLVADLALPASRYLDTTQVQRAYLELLSRLAHLPGVTVVGAGTQVPPARPPSFRPSIDGGEPLETSVGWMLATPGFLPTLDTPLLAGRGLRASDRAGTPPVAVVNESFARSLLGGRPLDRRVTFDGREHAVVGVVADQRSPGDERRPALYLAYEQSEVPVDYLRALSVVVRTDGSPGAAAAVQGALRGFDPLLPLALAPLEHRLASATPLARARFAATHVGTFAAAAALIAAFGIQGVLAFSARRRRHELSVRQALGADPARLASGLLRRAVALALAGTACGVAAMLALGALAGGRLGALGGEDPTSLLVASAVVLLLALLAGSWPALAAARVPPAAALRQGPGER